MLWQLLRGKEGKWGEIWARTERDGAQQIITFGVFRPFILVLLLVLSVSVSVFVVFLFFFVCVICFCRCTKEKRGKTRRLPRRVEMWNQRVSKLNQNWTFKDFYDWFYTERHTPKTEAEWHRKRSCPAKGAETSRGTLSEKWAFAASWAPPFPLPPLNPRQNPAGCFLFGGLY